MLVDNDIHFSSVPSQTTKKPAMPGSVRVNNKFQFAIISSARSVRKRKATLDVFETDLTIKEISARNEKESAHMLSREEMNRVRGGRAVAVLVDGRPGGVVDDFQLNMEIFKGNIGVALV